MPEKPADGCLPFRRDRDRATRTVVSLRLAVTGISILNKSLRSK